MKSARSSSESLLRFVVIFAMLGCLAGCSSSASAMPSTGSNAATADVLLPAPAVSSIVPASAEEGAAPLTVTITGSGFDSLSRVSISGSSRATTFVDASHLQAELTAGDLANKGKLSIAVTNPAPGGGASAALVFAVLSPPGGKFGPNFLAAKDAIIGGEGCCTTVADFNEDGIPDVATVHFTYDIDNPTPRDQMYVHFGDGHGNFRTSKVFKTGSGPIALVSGDFNHDGHVDLVSANTPIYGVRGPSSISIFLGDGKGDFKRREMALTFAPFAIAAGDFNRDGFDDLAIAGATQTQILLGRRDGTFEIGPTLLLSGDMFVGDFNEDGKLDLATNANGGSIFFGNGDGTFSAPQSLSAGFPGNIAGGDLDGDGHLDLILAVPNVGAPSETVAWGDGKGNFTLQDLPVPLIDFDVAAGDIRGVGRKDIVLGGTGVLYQTAPRTFTFDGSLYDFGDHVAVVDLNNDGFADVVGLRQACVRSRLSIGSHGLTHSQVTYLYDAKAVAAGDFNGDGKLDVAAATSTNITILPGDGTGRLYTGQPFGNFNGDIWGIVAGDFTGDGILDLAVGATDIVIYQGDGKGNFTEISRVPQVTAGDSGAVGTLLAADLTGNGKLDLVVAAVDTPNITVLLGDGKGNFRIGSQIPLGGFSIGMATADFNGDGRPDLAITDYGSTANLLRPYLGNGTGSFAAETPVRGGPAPYSVAAADFNKDGHIDLVIADFNFNTLYTMPETSLVLFGDGHGNFPRAQLLNTGSQPVAVAATDIDGDGWPDIVLMNDGNFDFGVYINDRNGSFLPPYTFAVSDSPSGFVIGDVDGDGRPDVISVIYSGIEVTLNRTIP